jgi:hypothetical protein
MGFRIEATEAGIDAAGDLDQFFQVQETRTQTI